MASPQFYRRFKDKIGVVTRSGEFSSGASENDGSPVSSLGKNSEQSQVGRKLKESASFAQLAARRASPMKAGDFSPESKSGAQGTLSRFAPRSPFLPEIREKLPQKAILGKLDSRNHSTLPLSLSTNSSFTLKSKEFHSYTIEDYKGLKKTPMRLGGLGPATIGTEAWVAARKGRDRRLAYSQALQPGRRVCRCKVMDRLVSICHYCREQEAYLTCSCTQTPLKLCFPCFQQHHTGTTEQDPATVNCQVCKEAEVDVTCSCQFPPLRLCKSCGNAHALSAGSIWRHNLEAVSGARVKNLDDQQYIVNVVFRNLQEDLSLIQRAVSEVNEVANAAVTKIEDWRKSRLKHLCEVQERVSAQIGLIKAQIDGKLAGHDYEVVTKLDQVMKNGEKYLMADTLKELSMFKYRFDSAAFAGLLERLFEFEEDYSLASLDKFAPPATKISMLHVVTGSNAILKYELPAGYMQVIRITRVSKFLPGTGWCVTSSGAIVFTGGEKSGDVIKQSVVVNPISKTAARLNDMTTARAFHGQIFYAGGIYVFGGASNCGFWTGRPDGLCACEKYSPDTCEWTALPDLIEARCAVSAVQWMDIIYIAGSGSARVEAFNPARSEMALLPYVIPGAKKHRLLLLPFENDLLVLKRSRLYRIRLSERSEDVLELRQYEKPVLDGENSQPTQLFDTFFIQTKKATFLLNAKTYLLEKAFKFPEIA